MKRRLLWALLLSGLVCYLWAIGVNTPLIIYPSGATVAEIRFLETFANGFLNYVGFKGPANLSANTVWELPAADGAANTVPKTNGAGVLAFAAIDSNLVSTPLKTGQFSYTFFDLNTDIPDTLDVPSIIQNRSRAVTITEVICEINAGSASINLQRDDGTPANILSSNLACTTGGATTTTFVAGETAIASGHNIDHVMVSVGASLRRVNVTIKYTIDP